MEPIRWAQDQLVRAAQDTAAEGAMALAAKAAGRGDEYQKEQSRRRYAAQAERQRSRLVRNLAVAGGAALVVLLLVARKSGKSNG